MKALRIGYECKLFLYIPLQYLTSKRLHHHWSQYLTVQVSLCETKNSEIRVDETSSQLSDKALIFGERGMYIFLLSTCNIENDKDEWVNWQVKVFPCKNKRILFTDHDFIWSSFWIGLFDSQNSYYTEWMDQGKSLFLLLIDEKGRKGNCILSSFQCDLFESAPN